MKYRWKRVLVRVRRWTSTSVKLVVLALGAFYLGTRTGPGSRLLVNFALSRANDALAGTITVGGIESRGVLGGVFLSDVRFQDPMGRSFVEVDSVRATYSLLPLIRGEVLLSSAEAWGPNVVVERLPGYEDFNFAYAVWGEPRKPSDGSGGDPFLRWFRIFQAQVHDGTVTVRMEPADGGGEPAVGHLRTLDTGETVVEVQFTEVNGVLPQAIIRAPGQSGEEFRLSELSLSSDLLSVPLSLVDLRGTVRRENQEAHFTAPRIWFTESEMSGEGLVDWSLPGVLQAELELSIDVVSSADLQWLPFPVPEASGAGGFSLARGPSSMSLAMETFEMELVTGGALSGDFRVTTGEALHIDGADLVLDGVDTRELDTWIPDSPLPPARLSGGLRMSGGLNSLQVDADLSVQDPVGGLRPFRGGVTGVFHIPAPFGLTGVSVSLGRFDYGWLGRWDSRIPFRGRGSVALDLTGRAGEGIQLGGDLTYGFAGLDPSAISFDGEIEGSGESARLNGNVTLAPLSLEAIGAEFPKAAALEGSIAGVLALEGTFGATQVSGTLDVPGGQVGVNSTLNLFDPAAGYSVGLVSTAFDLAAVLPALGDDAAIEASLFYQGQGLSPDSMSGQGELQIQQAHVGFLQVDSLVSRVSVEGGLFRVDTLEALTSALDLRGRGELGLSTASEGGRLDLMVSSESLEGLRPFFRSGEVIAQDTLNDLARTALIMAGVNPDTLPLLVDVETGGELEGSVTLTGLLSDFAADMDLTFRNVRYGQNQISGARAQVRMEALPGREGRWTGLVEMDSATVTRQRFSSGRAEVDFQWPRGSGEIRLARSETEDYLGRGSVEMMGDTTALFLDQLTLRFSDDQWNLGGPTAFHFADQSIGVRDLSLLRQGEGGMRLRANGVLARAGPVDFTLSTQRMDLSRLFRLLQIDANLEGLVDVEAQVSGTGTDPVLQASLGGVDLRYLDLRFDTLLATMNAADNRLRANATGWYGGLRALVGAVDMPLDIRAIPEGDRVPDEDLSIRVALQQFPAAAIMGFVEAVEDVQGLLNGTVTFEGSPSELRPGGEITLTGGALFMPALNVRHRDVFAVATLNADRTARIRGSLAAGVGTASVEGTITLDPLSNPGFDLNVQATNLLAVQRRDLSGTFSGTAHLGGAFKAPVLTGDIAVVQGELRLEEFVRSASVVDLTNPAVVDLIEDQSLLNVDAVILRSANPFMSNLRMDVNLGVRGDTWIRSRQLDVEMAGDLELIWDRSDRSMVMVGEIGAIRGTYNNLNRRFEVQGGTIRFAGTPELNPLLNIQSQTLIRTNRGEPLNIQATLEGTLLEPRVSLSSDFQPPIAESDLVSYLLFGQPSSGLLADGAVGQAGVGLALGLLTPALTAQLSRGIPFLDYLSVTSRPEGTGAAAATSGGSGYLTTSVEGGMYLRKDIFLGFRLPNVTNPSANNRPDVWVEITAWNAATLELFFEDRFSRDQVSGLGQLSFSTPKVWGGLLYKEWGY